MRSFLLSVHLFSALTLPAQWTGDPSAPLAICDAPLTQIVVQARPDGAGGSYVLWLDQRNGRREIWGQRVTADGLSLWAPNGQPLLALPGERHVSHYHLQSLESGGFIMAYVQAAGPGAGDTVRLARFDANGTSTIDPHPIVGGRPSGEGASNFACNAIEVLALPEGSVFVSWIQGTGTAERRLNVVAADGALPQGFNGTAFASSALAQHRLVPDGTGGAILAMMSSGTSRVRLQRFNFQLEAQWPGDLLLPPQQGHNVNSFGMASLGEAGFFVSWVTSVGQPGDLHVARFGINGLPAWAEVERAICTEATASQSDHQLILNDGHLLAAWRKLGIGSHLFAQKLTLDAGLTWPVDGAVVAPFPGTVGAPRIVGLPDGGALITSNGSAYAAQRLGASGNVLWNEATTVAVSPYRPETSWYDLFATADNGAVTFWHNGSDVFGAHVTPLGELAGPVGIDEQGRPTLLSAWPVPASNVLYVRLPVGQSSADVAVHTADGRLVPVFSTRSPKDAVLQLDVNHLAPGSYLVRIVDGAQVFATRFIKE